jgi:benzaldehyde dehydrogenase (NAD)
MAGLLDDLDWQGKVYSGGWTASRGGVLESTVPATGEVLATVGLADAADVAAAAAAARQAQPEWAAQPGLQRAALIRRAARLLEDNRAEFEGWLVREGGAIPGKAGFEVELVLAELWEAAALPTQPWGHLLPASEPGRQSIAKRVPLGVVGVISPWNFPLILSGRSRRWSW